MTSDRTDAPQQPTTGALPVQSVPNDAEIYRLRLYVAGASPKSLEAFANLKRLCEAHLANRYQIEIIDLLEHPLLARGDEIVAVPTLVRQLPAPMRRIIGDLSDTERVLLGLELDAENTG